MPTVRGTIKRPPDEVRYALRQAAVTERWTHVKDHDADDRIVFVKGASSVHWGSSVTILLEAEKSGKRTRVEATTSETWSKSEWGRPKKETKRLLEAAGVTLE